MHNHRVTVEELAGELGFSKGYMSMVLNSKRNPVGIREKAESALDTILKRRKELDI